jgi:hypothetical protein
MREKYKYTAGKRNRIVGGVRGRKMGGGGMLVLCPFKIHRFFYCNLCDTLSLLQEKGIG